MKKFTYREIRDLHLQIGSKSWTDSRMCGRCGISQKRLEKIKSIRPDIPTDVLIFPNKFVIKPLLTPSTKKQQV